MNDMKHGSGIYSTAILGTEYDGEWENDLQHGIGEYLNENGEQSLGVWKYGQFKKEISYNSGKTIRSQRTVFSKDQPQNTPMSPPVSKRASLHSYQ